MFRRTFWFTAGAAAGVWATTKVNRKIKALTPESLAAQAADKALEAGHRLKDFALDIKAGMAQREDELNDALGLHHDPEQARELPGPRRRAAIDSPAAGRTARREGAQYPRLDSYNRNEDH
ncbi:DUF6167 family protein [Streptomyces sp. NPDC089919]|uniref:DUF6167 family protein n=1 Tax=Streptomyces sp. NPDC089919 TaxID=3155188 RepID=UPI003425998F